jgi:uncharacterized protein (TIGR03067 family)
MNHMLFTCFALLVSADPDVSPEKDAKALEGAWNEVSRDYDGKEVEKRFIEKSKVIFKSDGKLSLIDGFKVERTYKLDASKSPKTIDVIDTITTTDKEGKKKTVEQVWWCGIYEMDGDKLTICYVRSEGPKAGQRPKALTSDAKSAVFKSVYQREKQ